MEKRKSVLLFEEGNNPISHGVILCLGLENVYNVHLLSLNPKYISPYRCSRYIKSYFTEKYETNDQAFRILKNAIRISEADVVIPVMERSVKIISENIEELKTLTSFPPIPETSTLELVINKWSLYNWLYENGLSKSRPILLEDVVQPGPTRENLTYPFIIKPFWGSGGSGIICIRTAGDLDIFLSTVKSFPQHCLIQHIIKGIDIDISAMVENGDILAYTIQKGIMKKKEFKFSSGIELLHDPDLLKIAKSIFKKLNYSGIAHLDFIYDEQDKTYHLIDFNARYWSSLLGSFMAGLNFPLLASFKALQIDLKNPEFRNDYFFLSKNLPGLLKTVTSKNGLTFRKLINNEMIYKIHDPGTLIIQTLSQLAVKLFH
jgi:predicted ATP-grasp superfamily ATP-dependent carboligase